MPLLLTAGAFMFALAGAAAGYFAFFALGSGVVAVGVAATASVLLVYAAWPTPRWWLAAVPTGLLGVVLLLWMATSYSS